MPDHNRRLDADLDQDRLGIAGTEVLGGECPPYLSAGVFVERYDLGVGTASYNRDQQISMHDRGARHSPWGQLRVEFSREGSRPQHLAVFDARTN